MESFAIENSILTFINTPHTQIGMIPMESTNSILHYRFMLYLKIPSSLLLNSIIVHLLKYSMMLTCRINRNKIQEIVIIQGKRLLSIQNGFFRYRYFIGVYWLEYGKKRGKICGNGKTWQKLAKTGKKYTLVNYLQPNESQPIVMKTNKYSISIHSINLYQFCLKRVNLILALQLSPHLNYT